MERREKERIIGEYNAAVKAYSDAVSRLVGLTGEDFRRAYRQAEDLRAQCEQCRKVLDHTDEIL